MQYNVIVVYTTAIFIECNLSLKQCVASDQNASVELTVIPASLTFPMLLRMTHPIILLR